ncbi:hypothetical protein IAQ61_002675 [Plenodomus lingam]|uniref:uncharacterized protein n=1 Tax=Leptosphaeria maculans TaxID=5022 RepID=UPI003321254F|nr:hypothetical protein IAQ61_002675 [Plenodomus lingam]
MFPKSLAVHLWGPLPALIVGLSICLVLNLGALIFSVRILNRGTRDYSASYPRPFSSHARLNIVGFLDGDRPRELPIKVGTIQHAFHDDPEHYHLEGMPAWAEWNAMRPLGKGYVFLGEEHFALGVSMWHQMHCLNHVRTVLINGDDGSDHTEHCFHYLRQGILCAADTTLEAGGTHMKLANGDHVATGVGTVHTCRNWNQVHDYLESQHEKWTPDMYQRFKDAS